MKQMTYTRTKQTSTCVEHSGFQEGVSPDASQRASLRQDAIASLPRQCNKSSSLGQRSMHAPQGRRDLKSPLSRRSMRRVDLRRMFRTPLFYIMLLISFVMPILILTMTSMVESPSGDTMAFTNTWQIIATENSLEMGSTLPNTSKESTDPGMDMTGMCNINLIYFLTGVFICLFIAADFSSGYAKTLFTVRARKADYVESKLLTGFLAGTLFLTAFFIGAILGGSFAGLSFDLGTAGAGGLILCMLAKIFLSLVFVSIFVAMSTIGKSRSWLSILLSLFSGMLLFMMIPMMTPLNSGFLHVFMCLAGGAIFAAAIGAISSRILNRNSLA